MKYSVSIKKSAQKELKDIPEPANGRIVKALLDLSENPTPAGVKKLRNRDGYRIRVGDYRILYTMDPKTKIVEIYAVGHRRDIYR